MRIKGGIDIAKQRHLFVNEQIRYPNVRLIDQNGDQVGIMPTRSALERAKVEGLDLVLMSNNPENPVARIMDYGRYAYEQAKREREARRNQKTMEVKEVQLKLTTEEHDLAVKSRNAVRFLEDGDRVKVVIRFRGREMAYTSRGYDVMNEFLERLGDIAEVDRPPRAEGRNMIMYLTPKKTKS